MRRVLDEKREQAKEASTATYATRDDATFLIMHGTNDQVVPLEQAEILHQALRQAKADSTFVKIIDGGHGFLCPAVSGRVSDFFAKHLLGQTSRCLPSQSLPQTPLPEGILEGDWYVERTEHHNCVASVH